MSTQYTPIEAKILERGARGMILYYAPEDGQNAKIAFSLMHSPIDLGEFVLCKAVEAAPAPTLADVVALLERQAETFERIAKTLTEIEYTVRILK